MNTLRLAIAGCGNRSRSVWQRHIRDLDGFELVGVQDIEPGSFKPAVEAGLDPALCYTNLDEMLGAVRADALIVCNVNAAHADAVMSALGNDLHALVEKPFALELKDAVRLTNLAEAKGLTVAVVQNWRTKNVGQALRAAVQGGLVGDVSHVFFRYLRDREAESLPGYLFSEPDPLLYAMSIHHLDLVRYALGQEFVHAEGRAFRPRWSRYEHPSSLQLWLETDGGVVMSYVATFSSRNGHLPLESLQVEGETGTLHNESEYSEPPLWLSRRGAQEMTDLTAGIGIRDRIGQYDVADIAILRNFAESITGRAQPIAPARDNLGTLAVIEAARLCTKEGRPIDPRVLLSEFRD